MAEADYQTKDRSPLVVWLRYFLHQRFGDVVAEPVPSDLSAETEKSTRR